MTGGHISQEVLLHVHFFTKEGGGRVNDFLQSAAYCTSLMSNGILQIQLTLTLRNPRFVTHIRINGFAIMIWCH